MNVIASKMDEIGQCFNLLVQVLKSEIECGWNGASKNVKIAVSTLIVSVVLILWF